MGGWGPRSGPKWLWVLEGEALVSARRPWEQAAPPEGMGVRGRPTGLERLALAQG